MAKYFDYVNVFSFNLALELPKNTDINIYTLELIEKKQLSFRPIYVLNLIKLKILKDYIEIYQKIGLIYLSKSYANTLIFINKKPDSNFCLCIIN